MQKIINHTCLSLSTVLLSVLLLCVASIAYAADVTWNINPPIPRLGHPDSIGVWGLSNVALRVEYHTLLKDADTGAVLSCGARVPKGTKVQYVFKEGVFDDVFWVGTGYNADSPYGEWITGAARPAGDICIERNLVHAPAKHLSASYGLLSVNPPTKTLTTPPPGCTKSGSVYSCTLNTVGTFPSTYVFSATYGKFYGTGGLLGSAAIERTDDGNAAFGRGGYGGRQDKLSGPLHCTDAPLLTPEVAIPEQQINCSITVTDTPGVPPTPPTLTLDTNACTTGTAYTLAFQATDSDNDKIRYGLDWDANGTVDQFIPATGYVNSGTRLTASHTFGTAGAKTVKVYAEDEGGRRSAWASTTFTCGAGTAPACPNGATNPPTCTTCAVGQSMSGGRCIDEDITGGEGGEETCPNGATNAPVCTACAIGWSMVAGQCEANGGGVAGLLPDLSINARPSLVTEGSTTRINWSATNVTACTVTAPNGDSWSGLTSIVGGNITRPLQTATKYTLTCTTDGAPLSESVTVRVTPRAQEI